MCYNAGCYCTIDAHLIYDSIIRPSSRCCNCQKNPWKCRNLSTKTQRSAVRPHIPNGSFTFEQRAWSYSIFFLNASPVRHSNKRRVVGFDLRQDRAERKSVPYRRHGGHSRHRPKRFRFHMPSLSPPFLCFLDIVAAPVIERHYR